MCYFVRRCEARAQDVISDNFLGLFTCSARQWSCYAAKVILDYVCVCVCACVCVCVIKSTER